MSPEQIITAIRADHEDLARAMKKHSGIRKIVEDLYPDEAHFIYELLQNAEDTGAKEVKFKLCRDQLGFEHNGRAFKESDVKGITDIGEGTKANDDDKIGRFGVGFKAVFAYSETPRVYSPTFCFEIRELVLPYVLPSNPNPSNRTCFEFPFNNPKKSSETAFGEVQRGLQEIQLSTLLFLTHISKIEIEIEGVVSNTILRTQEQPHLFRISRSAIGQESVSARFLRFDQPVENLREAATQKVCAAFEMEFLPKIQIFDSGKSIAQQMRIKEAERGMVSVFFPAAKEDSRLKFHIHAPFVPELSRASIKETPANIPLFKQLSSLICKAMHEIRDLGLLDAAFMDVLPNASDKLDERYKCIEEAIITEFQTKDLTPMFNGGHAPATELLQGPVSLKRLLKHEDLTFLRNQPGLPHKWSIGDQSRRRRDEFLRTLRIPEWEINGFVNSLGAFREGAARGHYRQAFSNWINVKQPVWFEDLYVVLFDYLDLYLDLDPVSSIPIVLTNSGGLATPSSVHFSGSNGEEIPGVSYAHPEVIEARGDDIRKKKVRKVLEEIGVTGTNISTRIKVILEARYSDGDEPPPAFEQLQEDFVQFVNYLKEENSDPGLFSDMYLFKGCNGDLLKPKSVLIDEPYLKTGLKDYVDAFGEIRGGTFLSVDYQNMSIGVEQIGEFAESSGCLTTLPARHTRCVENPKWEYLRNVPGQRRTSPIDRDFTLPYLKEAIASWAEEFGALIWRSMVKDCTDSKPGGFRLLANKS